MSIDQLTKNKKTDEQDNINTGSHQNMHHSDKAEMQLQQHEHGGHSGTGQQHDGHQEHAEGEHKAHVDHTGHEKMFRRKFWVSLILTIPVLVFSPAIQQFLGFISS